MQRYWDLSEEERAALSREDVDDMLSVELMERGVLRPKPPILEQEVAVELPTKPFFVVKGGQFGSEVIAAFEDAESAHALCRLQPFDAHDDWQLKTKYARPMRPLTVSTEAFATEDDIARHRAQLAQNAQARDRNEKARAQYEKEVRVVEKETTALLDDWTRCQARAAHLARVRETFDEYLKMAGGDRAIARGFLVKAYGSDDVADALGEAPTTQVPPGPSMGAEEQRDVAF